MPHFQTFEEEEARIQEIISRACFAKEGRILDVGTGMGWMAVSLAKSGYKVVTIEEKPEFITGARELASKHGVEGRIEFKSGSFMDMPLDKESFDGVVSYLTLHHVGDIEGTVDKMLKCCKKSGKAIIVELTEMGMGEVSKYHAHTHVHEVIDPLPILSKKDLDIQVFPGEITNIYVCEKRG